MSPSEARVAAAFKSLRLVLDRELPRLEQPLAVTTYVNKAQLAAHRMFHPTPIGPVFEGQLTIQGSLIGEPS